jgi:spore photoproduct lyase
LPSAEYALPLATGCIAHCHYCYLQTTMGAKPYVRIYVNTDEVFAAASRYIAARAPEVTRFEAACTSDPLSLEHISGSLAEAIQFFARQPLGRLRFVSKFAHVEPLLGLHHGGHTRIRFSINCDYVIKHFEGGTAPLQARIEAAAKVAKAGYPLGFIVAPIIWHDGWAEGYRQMVRRLVDALQAACGDWPADVTFELIQHRFTKRAKAVITSRYPHSALEMNEAERKYKWGRYGHGKYVYRDEQAKQLEESLRAAISAAMPAARVEYFT